MSDTTAGRTAVRFRAIAFDRLAQRRGHASLRAQARFLGVSASALSKIRSGKNGPSAAFIAAVCVAMPDIPFKRLFEVVQEQDRGAAA